MTGLVPGLVPVIHVVVYDRSPRIFGRGRSWAATTNLAEVDHGPTWMTGTSPVMTERDWDGPQALC